jgi:aspartate aminotransferase
MNYQSKKLATIQSSPSMAVAQAAKQMMRQGVPVVDLSLGEPDFDTPENVINAALGAMQSGKTRYTTSPGTPELLEAIASKLKRENGLDYAPSEISVGNGAKQIIFNALLGTLEEGDEVIILAPYFVSYPDLVKLHGGVPKIVTCKAENQFRPLKEDIEAAITEKTRWIMINTPSNPSGAVLSEEDLRHIGQAVKDHPRILVMSDEIYEKICFGEAEFVSFAKACPELRDRTLIINGLSKSHAMTGWRIGYGAGPQALIQVLNKLQSQSTTNACTISQWGSIEALNGDQTCVEAFRQRYEARRNLFMKLIQRVPTLKAYSPEGAFYVFADCSALIGQRTPDGQYLACDADVATYFLQQGHVACVPGAAYGLEPFVRFSFATSEEHITKAIENLERAVGALTPQVA